jgi:ABC-2 type transport system ATP-binding protein
MAAIEVHDLTKVFGDLVAVDHLNLSIDEGELFSLLGPNGAGKSTVMRMLSTLLQPTEGSATIMGHDVMSENMAVRKILGICPQETVLYDHLSGEENLGFFGTLQGLKGRELSQRIGEVLRMVQLEDARKRRFKTYSGGMKHRLNLGVALMHDPQVLILDEPTTGLDPQGRRAVWDVIKGFQARGRTVLLSTHYMEEADALSDRVAIMDRGKIIACDTSRELKDSLGGEEVIEVQSSQLPEDIADRLSTISFVTHASVQPPTEDQPSYVLKMFTEDADHTVPVVVQHIAARTKIERLEVVKPTLEDVFIRLTGRSLRE